MHDNGRRLIATVALVALLVLVGGANIAASVEPGMATCAPITLFGMDISWLLCGDKATAQTSFLATVVAVLLANYQKIAEVARSILSHRSSTRTIIELEKSRLELLKLDYEIAALRKQHQLDEIRLPEELQRQLERVQRTGRAAIQAHDQIPEIKEIVNQQLRLPRPPPYFLRRAGAFMVDYAIMGILFNVSSFVVRHDELDQAAEDFVGVFFGVSFLLYFGLMHYLFGYTIGKWVFSLRVVGANGERLTWRQAIIRLLAWLTNWLWSFGVLWALWDKNHLFLDDRLAGTRTVYLGYRPQAGASARVEAPTAARQ